MHLMFDANELQTGRLAEESENGVEADLLEEIRLFDGLQQCDLLIRAQAGDRSRSWKKLGAFRLGLSQAALVELLLVLIVAGDRPVNEPDNSRCSRARCIVIGDDLGRDGLDFSGVRWI